MNAPTTSPTEVASARTFLDRIFPVPRRFAIRLWEGSVLPADGEAAFTLVFHDSGSIRRMFQTPVELSLGEAYLRREFDVQGDLPGAFEIMHAAREVLSSPRDVLGVVVAYRALPRSEGATGLWSRCTRQPGSPASSAARRATRRRSGTTTTSATISIGSSSTSAWCTPAPTSRRAARIWTRRRKPSWTWSAESSAFSATSACWSSAAGGAGCSSSPPNATTSPRSG